MVLMPCVTICLFPLFSSNIKLEHIYKGCVTMVYIDAEEILHIQLMKIFSNSSNLKLIINACLEIKEEITIVQYAIIVGRVIEGVICVVSKRSVTYARAL